MARGRGMLCNRIEIRIVQIPNASAEGRASSIMDNGRLTIERRI